MCRTVTSTMDQTGCLDDFSHTNERTRAEYVVASRRPSNHAKSHPNPNGTSVSLPDFSGSDVSGLTNHQNHQQQQQQQGHYYDASRHSKQPSQYQRSPANTSLTPLSASTPNPYYFPSAVDAMSLSYETRTFPSYPSMMHEHPQEQDDNDVQHHRYPSPPPPLSENPYHPQNIDPTAGINMEMPELPQKDESDAPSPGRSRPIPKPDREVTKGEDGRFVCTWAGCTEEVKSFNRKCEWSKVSGCAFPKYI